MRAVYLVYVLSTCGMLAALLGHAPAARADARIVIGLWSSGCQDETERDGSIGSYCPTHAALLAQKRAEHGRVLCEARSLMLYDTDASGRRVYVGEAFFYIGQRGCIAPESAGAHLRAPRGKRDIWTMAANVGALISAGLAREAIGH